MSDQPSSDQPKAQEGEPSGVEFVEVTFPTYYTNNITFASSPLDFAMLIMERLDNDLMTVRARVVMTPALARLMLDALAKQVMKHEARWGEIVIPVVSKPTTSSSEPEPQP